MTERRGREHAELRGRQESSDRNKSQRVYNIHVYLYSAKLRQRQESSDRRKRKRVYLVQS